MNMLALLRVCLRAIRRNKMRSALTMLGIVIGVAAVISMVAITSGARESVQAQIASLGDNVFMIKKTGKGSTVKDYILLTPPTYLGALKGITRQAILEIAEKIKLPSEERVITRHDLFNADEVFLTGTAAEVIPVVKIDGRGIGDGIPGKITKLLLKHFHELTHKDGVCYTL